MIRSPIGRMAVSLSMGSMVIAYTTYCSPAQRSDSSLLLPEKSVEKLVTIIAATQSDSVLMIADDTVLKRSCRSLAGIDSPKITWHTTPPAVQDSAWRSATIIVDTCKHPHHSSITQSIQQLTEGARLLLTYELDDDTPDCTLKAMHALGRAHGSDLMLYEYQIEHPTIETQLTRLYAGVDGSCISQADAQAIRDTGGDPVYGEITFASAQQLFTELVPLGPDDIFYDLGSGIGKLVLWVYVATATKRCVGIELSDKRYTTAQTMKGKVLATMKPLFHAVDGRSIDFIHADIGTAPIDDATVIFVCATCFSDRFMALLADRFSQLKEGTRIISLKRLPQHDGITEVAVHTLQMTWAKDPVYIYRISHHTNSGHKA